MIHQSYSASYELSPPAQRKIVTHALSSRRADTYLCSMLQRGFLSNLVHCDKDTHCGGGFRDFNWCFNRVYVNWEFAQSAHCAVHSVDFTV